MFAFTITGIVLGLLDPVKWVVASIPQVVLIKSGTIPAPSPHFYHQPGFTIPFGAVLGTGVSAFYSGNPLLFNFLSSIIIAMLVSWLRVQWLRRNDKSKEATLTKAKPAGTWAKTPNGTRSAPRAASFSTEFLKIDESMGQKKYFTYSFRLAMVPRS